MCSGTVLAANATAVLKSGKGEEHRAWVVAALAERLGTAVSSLDRGSSVLDDASGRLDQLTMG